MSIWEGKACLFSFGVFLLFLLQPQRYCLSVDTPDIRSYFAVHFTYYLVLQHSFYFAWLLDVFLDTANSCFGFVQAVDATSILAGN